MNCPGWIDLLQKFQAAIVGLVGFAGVILTLYTNARVARSTRLEILAQERRALRTALRQELLALKTALLSRIEDLGESQKSRRPSVLIPTLNMTAFYDASIAKLGLLTASEVEKVMHAYLSDKNAMPKIWLLEAQSERPEHFINIPPEHFWVVKGMYENIVPAIDAAIDALSAP